MKIQFDLNRVVNALQEEARLVSFTLKDKGTARFTKAVGIAVAMVAASHFFVYTPPVKKLARLDKKLAEAQATAQYADAYKEMRERLNALYSRLPAEKDRSQWLHATVVESLRAEGLIADSILPPSESEQSGLVFQSVSVQLTTRFPDLMRWLARIEGTKPMIHVASLSVAKKSGQPDQTDAAVILSTVIPKVRY